MKWLIVRLHLLGWLLLMPASAGFGQIEKPAGPSGSQVSDKTEPAYQISERTRRQDRNSAGFSLGVLGLYDSNFFGTSMLKEGQAIASFAPMVFANLRRRNSLLNLNYQLMYRRYPGSSKPTATDHVAGLDYDFRPWRRVNVKLSDNVRFGPNDLLLFGDPANAGGSPQVFFDPQNMLSNSLSGAIVFTTSRKGRLEVSGRNELMRFDSRPDENSDTTGARARHEYQWSRQWTLTAEISNEWVRSTNGIRNGSILRILGGSTYKPGKGWSIGGQAGGDRIHLASEDSLQPAYGASVARDSASNLLSLQYWRRTSYRVGLPGLNQSDSVDARFEYRFLSRLSVRFQTQYSRTLGVEIIGGVKSISGRVGFEYAIIPNLLLSVSGDYFYQRQQSPVGTGTALKLDKFMIATGLYYFYPATKR